MKKAVDAPKGCEECNCNCHCDKESCNCGCESCKHSAWGDSTVDME